MIDTAPKTKTLPLCRPPQLRPARARFRIETKRLRRALASLRPKRIAWADAKGGEE